MVDRLDTIMCYGQLNTHLVNFSLYTLICEGHACNSSEVICVVPYYFTMVAISEETTLITKFIFKINSNQFVKNEF